MGYNFRVSKIKRRIDFFKAIVASFFIVTILFIAASIAIFKTMRTFASGESLWARSQITANYNLSLYVTSRDETYYNEFKKSLELIKASEAGLNEILTNQKITPKTYHYFEAALFDRNDLMIALRVLLYFKDLPLIEGRIIEWERGNKLIAELEEIAEKIHNNYQNKNFYSPEQTNEWIKKIYDHNLLLSLHEKKFTDPLIQFARTTENLLGVLQLTLFLCYALLALYIDYSTAQIFKRSLLAIKNSIKDAVSGNLNVKIHIPPEEDIAGISEHLNLMYQSFNEQLKGRLSAEESEARLAILADTMPQIVCIYNQFHELEFLNTVGRQYLGVNQSPIKNFSIANFCPKEDQVEVKAKIQKGLRDKEAIEMELQLKNSRNEYHWFLCRLQPIFNDQHEIVRWYGSFTNIQTQKNYSSELEKSIQIRDQFLSIASHELKTPLTALKLQTGMRQRMIDKKIIKDTIEMDYFQKIVSADKKQIDRLTRLVDDMLDVSRIKSGKLSLDFTESEVNTFINDIIQRFLPEFNERNCQLIFHNMPETLCYWDLHRIEQVMINLLSNTLKYGGNKDVVVKLEKVNDIIKIHVTDQGEGIKEQDQMKIFELFERANHDQSISGLGLGLFIVNQIIQSHQGSVEVMSSHGKGSTFTISLPTRVESNSI